MDMISPLSITGSGYTVEHIMPQNPDPKKEWKEMLGDNWKEVQRVYLHTLGNLTLTGYNSELNDRPFIIKQTIKGGFKNSHLRLNNVIADLAKWDENEIKDRTSLLAEQIVKIWKYPNLSEAVIEEYLKKENPEPTFTSIEHYSKMLPAIAAIYEEIDRKIFSLDAGIRKEYKQQYIAYKVESNFTNIKLSKNELTIGLNIPFDSIDDPLGICRDTTSVGNFGNNDVLFKVTIDSDTNDVLDLVTQAIMLQI